LVKSKRVLVAGEINADLLLIGYKMFPQPGREVLVEDSQMALGSASAICAMGLARLGTPVSFVGVVGNDVWGEYCLSALRARGIDLSAVRVDNTVKTGMTVSISAAVDRALVTYPGASTALRAEDITDEMLRNADHVHVSSFFLQAGLRPGCRELFARASRLGLTTSLDPGFDPATTWGADLQDVLIQTDVFLPNAVELEAITKQKSVPEALRTLENGRTLTIAKLGAHGAVARSAGELHAAPAFCVDTVETTGAGDSFNAGFLHAWLRGDVLDSALKMGCACGALSTQGVGGTAGQPTFAQAKSLIASTGERKKP
jgi:sugar/nucleoside kinase (ribokinase family)